MKRYFLIIIMVMSIAYCGFFTRYSFLLGERGDSDDVKYEDVEGIVSATFTALDKYVDIMTLNTKGIVEDIGESIYSAKEKIEEEIKEKGFWGWFKDLIKLPII